MESWNFQRHDKGYLVDEPNGTRRCTRLHMGLPCLCDSTNPTANLTCLGYGLGPLVIAHVVIQAQPLQAAQVLCQACDRLAGLDGAAHILKCQLLQSFLQTCTNILI